MILATTGGQRQVPVLVPEELEDPVLVVHETVEPAAELIIEQPTAGKLERCCTGVALGA